MKRPPKEKTYKMCKSRKDILESLADYKLLMREPDIDLFSFVFCGCCGFVRTNPATARILKAAGWIEKVGERLKAGGKVDWEEWGISDKGRKAII